MATLRSAYGRLICMLDLAGHDGRVEAETLIETWRVMAGAKRREPVDGRGWERGEGSRNLVQFGH